MSTVTEVDYNNHIDWKDVVGAAQTIEDGGKVGDLLHIARAHIAEAIRTNELTRAEAGAIYTQMIPAAFQNAIEFSLREIATEADVAVKLGQLTESNAKTIAELDKQWGYGSAKIANGVDDKYTLANGNEVVYDKGTIILGSPDTEGMIDKQVEKMAADVEDAIATKERNDNLAIADIAIKSQQELAEKIKNGDVTVTYKYTYTDAATAAELAAGSPATVTRTTTGSLQDVFDAKDGVITSTVYSDTVGNTPSIYALQKQDVQESIQEKQQQNRILANKT